ncbi:MAG TPA: hypothetical protein VFV95_01555 [Vicinamibacterales bacterium]|nr:hypothetical protein [Vicinamibacterales bacterium]
MRNRLLRTVLAIGVGLAALLSIPPFSPSPLRAATLPAAIPDDEFWKIVTDLSEAGGSFAQELMSNEDSAQFVIPALKASTSRGGVYIGVGPEQNFTYIAAVQPALAFVLDIRRDNLLQHLIYKAVFERSADRADFLSRLFSRKRPSGLDASSSVTALFDAYQAVEADAELYEDELRDVTELLTARHRFQLSDADRAGITRIMQAFRTAGPHNLKGSGDKNLTYVQAMTATDLAGSHHGFLASEENFRVVQQLERRNLIVPVVGDFAGDKALASVGRYLAERDAIVDVFYVSNVERYLFEQGDRGRRFYANVATLPLGPSSTFIRSVTRDISRRLNIPLPDASGNWWSLLSPIHACLDAVTNGRVVTYPQLFEVARD